MYFCKRPLCANFVFLVKTIRSFWVPAMKRFQKGTSGDTFYYCEQLLTIVYSKEVIDRKRLQITVCNSNWISLITCNRIHWCKQCTMPATIRHSRCFVKENCSALELLLLAAFLLVRPSYDIVTSWRYCTRSLTILRLSTSYAYPIFIPPLRNPTSLYHSVSISVFFVSVYPLFSNLLFSFLVTFFALRTINECNVKIRG